jgi:hypothetical protein
LSEQRKRRAVDVADRGVEAHDPRERGSAEARAIKADAELQAGER